MAYVSSSSDGELPEDIKEPRQIDYASSEPAENCSQLTNSETGPELCVYELEHVKCVKSVTAETCCKSLGGGFLPPQCSPSSTSVCTENLRLCSDELDVSLASSNVVMQEDNSNVDQAKVNKLVSDSFSLVKGNSSSGIGANDYCDSVEEPAENSAIVSRGDRDPASDQLKDAEDMAEQEDRDAESSSYATTASSASGETDDSVEFGGYTVNRITSDNSDSDSAVRASSTADAVHDSDDQDESMAISRRMERARRKRLHSLLRQSSSSSDNVATDSDSSGEPDEDIDAKSSRLDVAEETAAVELPADTWRPVIEIFRRQIGGIGRQQNRCHHCFTRRVGGSVRLVSKLMPYDKHEVHDGCVNALHFNETGFGS